MNLIYFSPQAYASYIQRPHYMTHFLLSKGIDAVLWLDPYPVRLPNPGDLFGRKHRRHLRPSRPDIEVMSVLTLPIEPLPGGTWINSTFCWPRTMARLTEFASKGECTIGVGRPYALAAWAIDHLPHAFSFYDAMDDFPAFYRGLSLRSVARWETQVAKRVDRVFCSSHALLQQFQEKGCTTELLLNGYSMTSLPERSPTGSNIIGYIGTISTWFDWPMVIEMAAALPETTVRLIGPELVRRPPFLPANIEILSECDQSMAIKHVSKFDVGLIPFVRNRLTRSVDPIKYYEYRSLGLPVWSSDFGEMSWRDGHDGVVKIKSGLNWRNLWQHRSELVCSPEQLAEFRRKYDWNVRFSQLASCIGY